MGRRRLKEAASLIGMWETMKRRDFYILELSSDECSIEIEEVLRTESGSWERISVAKDDMIAEQIVSAWNYGGYLSTL